VTKAEFARLAGVDRSRVSQWIAAGQLSGEALVAVGRGERIDVVAARRQLGQRVDVDQRLASRARRGDAGGPLEALQRERLVALELANAEARAEAMMRSGRYIEADGARVEMGRIAAGMISAFDGALPVFADAVAAGSTLAQRDVLRMLNGAWREIRARLAGEAAAAAATAPQTVEASL